MTTLIAFGEAMVRYGPVELPAPLPMPECVLCCVVVVVVVENIHLIFFESNSLLYNLSIHLFVAPLHITSRQAITHTHVLAASTRAYVCAALAATR